MSALTCGLLQIDPSGFDKAHDFQVFLTARDVVAGAGGGYPDCTPAYSVMIGPALQLEAEGRSPCNPFELASSAGTDGFSVWMDFFAATALSNRVYLCPGTFIAPCDGGFEHRAPVFSPDGDLLTVQLQTHVSDAESQAGMTVGTDLAVVDVYGRKVGIAIDRCVVSGGRPHSRASGCRYDPGSDRVPAPYTVWHQTRGLCKSSSRTRSFVEASLRTMVGHTTRAVRAYSVRLKTPDGRGVLERSRASQSKAR